MNSSTRDAGIPVLTEVISAPVESSTAPAAPVAPSTMMPPKVPAATLSESRTAGLSSEDWNQLEQQIRERILRQITDRIDALLEQRLRDGMTNLVQNLVQNLTKEIKTSLHLTIGDVVTRAVAQEISRMQNSKK